MAGGYWLWFRPGGGGGSGQEPDPELPTVSLTDTDVSASEQGAATGVVTVSRTGPTTAALTVNYAIGGTAVNGTDYNSGSALSGSIEIPIGQASAAITITPVDDADFEGDESVILTVEEDAAYNVGALNSVTVTIADNDDLPASTGHPRMLTTSSGRTALRTLIGSDAAVAARYQADIDQLEASTSRWRTSPSDAYANAFAAFLTMLRRSDDDLGLTWSISWQTYRDNIVAAALTWTNIGGTGGSALQRSIGLSLIYDCLYDDLTTQERTDMHALIEAGFAAAKYFGGGSFEVWDNGTSDDHASKVFCALASETYQDRFALAYERTMLVVDSNDWMGYGFGLGREFHEGYPSRQCLPMMLMALRNASDGAFTDAETIDHFLVHLRDAGQLVQQAIIPHPSSTVAPNNHWVSDKFHTQDPIKFFHRQGNAAAYLVNALAFLPGKVDLSAAGMSDQGSLAVGEEEFFRYLWGLLEEVNPSNGKKLSDVLDVSNLGQPPHEDSAFWVFPAWLIHNAPDYSASTLTRDEAGIPRVRRWWPGTLEWTFIESDDFSRDSGSVIRFTHRRYGASQYEEGTRQNGRWHVHRDGPLLVQGGETGHGATSASVTWAANGCVSFVDYSLYPEFTRPPGNSVDVGGQRAFSSQGRWKDEILAQPLLDYGQVTAWHAEAACVATTSDLTRSYNSTPVQSPSSAAGNERKISTFVRELIVIRRGADGTDREKVFTFDRIQLLDTKFTPLYHLCPATNPNIDGTETPHTPWSPSTIPEGSSPPEIWTATGPTRWDYPGATRLIYSNAVEPSAPIAGNGKVCVTWLDLAGAVVRKMSGLNAVSAAKPTGSGTPGINPWNGWMGPKEEWGASSDLHERAYVGVYTVSVAPPDVAAWNAAGGHFAMACEVMAAADTPATAEALTSDAASKAYRIGASAVVFGEAAGARDEGDVDLPSGVVLVVLSGLPVDTVMELTATGGLSITTGNRTTSPTGVLSVGVSGDGNLAWALPTGGGGGGSLSLFMGTFAPTDEGFVYRAKTNQEALLQLDVSPNSDLSGSTRSTGVTTSAADDFTGGETITGKSADTLYYVAPVVDGVRQGSAPWPKTRTAPAEGVDAPFRFIVASCQKHVDAVTGCWNAAVARVVHFLIHLGDFVYGDHNTLATCRQGYVDEYGQANQQLITNAYARFQETDDHDSAGNNADSSTTGIAFTRQAWKEYVGSPPLWDGANHIGYSAVYANTDHFFLDTRTQRESSLIRWPVGVGNYADAQSGTDEDTVVVTGVSGVDGSFTGRYLKLHDGIGGQVFSRRVVSSSGSSTRTCTLDRPVTGLTTGWKVAVKRASMLDKGNLVNGQVERLCGGIETSPQRWHFIHTSVIWNRRFSSASGLNDCWADWDPEHFEREYIRQRLAGIPNIWMVSGDRHFCGLDSGALAPDGPDFPEATSSAFHRVPLDAVCEWDNGVLDNEPGFVEFEVETSPHQVTASIYDADGNLHESMVIADAS